MPSWCEPTWSCEAGPGRDAEGRRHHGRRHAEQAKVAEDAGAVAVMALERVPADIRVDGGVARMSDPR
jgi:pyridoxal 5'-phosphate synthase pdxS subunit